jgi:tape measure domain-containing protein
MAVNVKGGPLEFSASIDLGSLQSQLDKLETELTNVVKSQSREQQKANQLQKEYAQLVIQTGSAFKNLDGSIQGQLKNLSSLQTQLQKVKEAQGTLSQRHDEGLIGDDTFSSSMGALINKEKELSQAVAKVSQEMQTSDAIMKAADGSIVQKTLHLENLKRQYSELSQADRNTAAIGGNLLGNIQKIDEELRVINSGFQVVQQNAVGSINAKTETLTKLKNEYAALAETDRNSNIGAKMLSNIHALDEELKVINNSFQAVQKNASGSLNEKVSILNRLKNEYAALAEVDRKGSAGKELAKNIRGLDKEVQKINSELSTTESVLKKTAAAIAAYATLTTAGNFIKDVVRTRGEFQQLEVAFKTMLGSKEKADKLMAEVTQFAATTPFELSQVANATRSLLAFGISADKIKSTLRALGDVSAGIGAPIEELAQLYGKAKVQGRLFAEDINQLTGRGVPIIQELAKQFGVADDEVKKLVESGKVGFPQIEKAFQDLTAAGSLFGGLMEAQSKTLTGQLSNLSDAWSRMLNNIGKSNEGAFSGAISAATSLVDNYETVLDILKVLILTYGSYRAAIIANAAVQAVATSLTQGYTIAETLRLQAMLLSERAMKFLNATMLSNPYVAVITGLTAVVATLFIFRKEAVQVKSATELLNTAQKKSADTYADQQAKILPYLQILKAGNVTEQQRLDIYKKLQEIDASIVKGIDDKSLSYENLKKNVDAYLDSLRNQLAVEANQEAITASIKQEQVIDEQIKQTEKRIKLQKELNAAPRSANAFAPGSGSAAEQGAEAGLKSLQEQLAKQKAITDELAKQGATQTGQATESQQVHRRTVEVIQDEIKALKDQRDKVSATSKEYTGFTENIKKLEKELEAITGKDAAKSALKDAKDRTKELQDLLKDIAKAEEDARKSGLTKEESEIDKINVRYDELKKRAQELKLSEGVLQRIENARSEQTGNERQKNQADDYKKFIKNQQDIFTRFEEYKLQFGEKKAKELTDFQTADFSDAIEFLKIQLALVSQDLSFAGKLKKEFLVNAIATAEKDKIKRDTEKQVEEFKKVADATVTFNIKRKQLEEQYQKDIVTLRKNFTGDELTEREAALKQSHDDEITELERNAKLQSGIFKKMNEDILFYSRDRIKKNVKDLEQYLKSNTNIPPAVKKQIEEQIKSLNGFLKETSAAGILGNKMQEIGGAVSVIGDAFSQLGSALEGVNDGLAETLQEMGSVVDIAGSAITALGQFAAGDILGGISSAVSVVTKVLSIGKKNREESRRHQKEVEEFNMRVFTGEQDINLLYQQRAREQVKINKLRLEGLQDERKLLEQQVVTIKGQYDTVFAELQKQTAKVAKTIAAPVGSGTFTIFTTESLTGKTFDELEQLFLKGQLEGKAKDLFEVLQKIKAEGVDVDKLLEENKAAVAETFTGTTADSITDSIVDGFKNGLRSAKDFADTFQELMKNAVLQSLKMQALEGPLKDFYAAFAAASESDNILTQQEIDALNSDFATIIENAGKKFEDLQKITNLDFASDGTTGSGKSLAGAIRGITEQQADLLAGQFGGLRLTALDHLKVASSQLSSLQAIQNHTANLEPMYRLWQRLELNGLKVH